MAGGGALRHATCDRRQPRSLQYNQGLPRSAVDRDQITGKAVRSCAISRTGDHDRFKFHISASILLVSRDTMPISVGTVPSVSTPCAPIWVTAPLHQQRLSGPTSETAKGGSVGNQAQSECQTPHSECVRRPIRLPTATADYTTGPVCCLR